MPISIDVAVIGGGPAGISACLELSRRSTLNVTLFESEHEIGGIPRSCHFFFGLRDRKRVYTGPAYARKLKNLIRKTDVDIHTNTTVIKLEPGSKKEPHRIKAVSPRGLETYESRFVLLATGCHEASREARRIPGTRPAGIFTTGTLQTMVRLQGLRPGRRAVIIGTEHVALSSALTLKSAGIPVAGMVEEDPHIQTYPFIAQSIRSLFGFPIYKGFSVKSIQGKKRVESVVLESKENQKELRLECDTVIVTGKFRPDAALIYHSPIQDFPLSGGPAVDMDLMTSVHNIFAAGNILRGANMHDLCALEGKQAARSILRRLESDEQDSEGFVPLNSEYPIRYIAPQKIDPEKIKRHLFDWPFPGFDIQVAHTVERPVLQAWSGTEQIWKRRYSRLLANTRIPMPVQHFNWDRVDHKKGVTLKLSAPLS